MRSWLQFLWISGAENSAAAAANVAAGVQPGARALPLDTRPKNCVNRDEWVSAIIVLFGGSKIAEDAKTVFRLVASSTDYIYALLYLYELLRPYV